MVQMMKQNGVTYKFPDDASLDEINNFFHHKQQSGLIDSVKSAMPSVPHGLNIATGLMSLAFPDEQAEMVKNLPQVLANKQPGFGAKTEQFVGEMLPGLEGGGPQVAKESYQLGKKGLEYINPENISEQLRGKFGEGTVGENIGQLAKRIKFGKESAKEEALVPKREFMETAKGGKIVKGDELGKSRSLYTTNEPEFGSYLGNKVASEPYPAKSKLMNAHNQYAASHSVESADKLMSGLKDELRELDYIKHRTGNLNDAQESRYGLYKKNLENIKNDWSKYITSLPEKERGKYDKFAKKYAINVGPYEEGGPIIHQLAKGNFEGITAKEIDSLFTNPNPDKQILKIINDIGPSGWNNIVYNMLSKYKPGEANKMAQAILEGARKGSPIITEEMINAANHALKRGKISSLVKASSGAAAGAIAGSAFGLGPLGAAVGAVSPYVLANKDVISKAIQRFKR